MDRVDINLKERSYPIYISGNYETLGDCIHAAGIKGKIVVLTDTNVNVAQYASCISSLENYDWDIHKYVMEPGEKNKNLATVNDIYSFLKNLKLDRNSTILALGGGVVGDIAGFVAATFLRGINFVQVPTSLLAQADSSVGGKVGVDFEGSKNIIGAFYQPKLVYINVNSLRTLLPRELLSGLAETIKHGIILEESFFSYIERNVEKILGLDNEVLQYIARTNCTIKGKVVQEDEKETGIRAILNFGHTIGHGIESQLNFNLLHGECVSIGMVGAFKMASYMGLVDYKEAQRTIELLEKIGLPTKVSDIDIDSLYDQMFYDKKIRDGKLMFILPRKIGQVEQHFVDNKDMIKRVLRELVK